MADLGAAARKKLAPGEFALPSKRMYPMDTIDRARLALAMASKHASPSELATVKRNVHKRWPSIQIT